MKKTYLFSLIGLVLGSGCLLIFNVIGSRVAQDGTLIEPFGLIPIGLLLIAISLISAAIKSGFQLFHKPKKLDKFVFGFSIGLIIITTIYFIVSFSYLNKKTEKEISPSITIPENEAKTIAEKSCIKEGEIISSPGSYNQNSKTWWFDVKLKEMKNGCNPACVVSEETKTAEINWRCTGLAKPKLDQ